MMDLTFIPTAELVRTAGAQAQAGEILEDILRACLKSHFFLAETFEHQANHSQIDHGFAGFGLSFVVAIESAVASEPTEGAFHHPAARQHLEGVKVGALDDLDGAAPQSPGPFQQCSRVAAVGPDMFDAPASLPAEEGGQPLFGPIPILNIGGKHHDYEEQADRIDQDMPLASVDFFAGVVTPLVARLGALDTLAVDDGRAGLPFAPFHLACLFPQAGVNGDPQTVALPGSEVMINRAPRGKALGQIAPLAGGLAEVEDPVEQFPIAVLSGPPGLARLGKTIVDEVPFGVRQIRSVSHPQGTAGICLHCTYKNADFIGTILSFQTGSKSSAWSFALNRQSTWRHET